MGSALGRKTRWHWGGGARIRRTAAAKHAVADIRSVLPWALLECLSPGTP